MAEGEGGAPIQSERLEIEKRIEPTLNKYRSGQPISRGERRDLSLYFQFVAAKELEHVCNGIAALMGGASEPTELVESG